MSSKCPEASGEPREISFVRKSTGSVYERHRSLLIKYKSPIYIYCLM
jgi:hypothetical protein